jgi:hypothetical protein
VDSFIMDGQERYHGKNIRDIVRENLSNGNFSLNILIAQFIYLLDMPDTIIQQFHQHRVIVSPNGTEKQFLGSCMDILDNMLRYLDQHTRTLEKEDPSLYPKCLILGMILINDILICYLPFIRSS